MKKFYQSLACKVAISAAMLFFLLGSFTGLTPVKGEGLTDATPLLDTTGSGSADASSDPVPDPAPPTSTASDVSSDQGTVATEPTPIVEPGATLEPTAEPITEPTPVIEEAPVTTEEIIIPDTTPPNPPVGLKGEVLEVDLIQLSWNHDPDATTYQVYRDGVLLESIQTNQYSDHTAAPNQTYLYTVEAVDLAGNVSTPASAEILSIDTAPPTAPENFRVKTVAANQNQMRWESVTDNRGVSHYIVYRSINGNPFIAIAETHSTHFIDEMTTTGEEYSYKISAVDTSRNESSFSETESEQMPDDRSRIVYHALPLEDF